MNGENPTDTQRLETLWSGDFGNEYVDRNADAAKNRDGFWRSLLAEYPVRRILEVGCNLGGNLSWISQSLRPGDVFGVDVNEKALARLRADVKGVNAVLSTGRELPFRDRYFDMTFSMCVLIHQAPDALPIVMSEIVRCSKRYVLCGEYYSAEPTEVPYRGQRGALFKRDYGGMYASLFPELTLRKKGFMGIDQGFDDVTWWLFERTS